MAYSHILAATDFSATGNHAVRCALEEAERHGAKVTLLHVLHHQPDTNIYFFGGSQEQRTGLRQSLFAYPYGYEPDTGGRLPMSSPPAPTSAPRDFDEEALGRLRDLVPDTFTGSFDAAVASGDPARAIAQIAREHHADLIVVGAHGSTSWSEILLGSVAEKVVRHAPCGVLTVRAPRG